MRLVADHQHDPGTAHLGHLRRHRAQAPRSGVLRRACRGESSEDPRHTVSGHGEPCVSGRSHVARAVSSILRVSDREALNEDQIQRLPVDSSMTLQSSATPVISSGSARHRVRPIGPLVRSPRSRPSFSMVAPDPGDRTADGCEEHTMNDAAVPAWRARRHRPEQACTHRRRRGARRVLDDRSVGPRWPGCR